MTSSLLDPLNVVLSAHAAQPGGPHLPLITKDVVDLQYFLCKTQVKGVTEGFTKLAVKKPLQWNS